MNDDEFRAWLRRATDRDLADATDALARLGPGLAPGSLADLAGAVMVELVTEQDRRGATLDLLNASFDGHDVTLTEGSDGWSARCSCGWRSYTAPQQWEALEAGRAHANAPDVPHVPEVSQDSPAGWIGSCGCLGFSTPPRRRVEDVLGPLHTHVAVSVPSRSAAPLKVVCDPDLLPAVQQIWSRLMG